MRTLHEMYEDLISNKKDGHIIKIRQAYVTIHCSIKMILMVLLIL